MWSIAERQCLEWAGAVAVLSPRMSLQGKDGSYGTSLCWQTAMDESCDVILAYKQNDRYLLPDHGAPIRIIIPGHIGGRMVKWLEEITVSDVESDNFYHYHDNRVLPPGIEQENAKEEGMYFSYAKVLWKLPITTACKLDWLDLAR